MITTITMITMITMMTLMTLMTMMTLMTLITLMTLMALGPNWYPSGTTLVLLWDQTGITLGPHWYYSGTTLRSFSSHFFLFFNKSLLTLCTHSYMGERMPMPFITLLFFYRCGLKVYCK